MSSKPVILTGLRANNELHIGNYFGALLPMVDMAKNKSKDYQINLFIPDLHSITTPIDYKKLQDQIMQNLKVFVASGLPLDEPDVHLYRQSYIPAHSELTWILDCFTGFGEMSRMTQFKDKKDESKEVSVGLFNYPVMMAADILLYGAEYVPVGDDQTQHLEYTRDIAERINNRFGNIFIIPKAVKEQHKFFAKDQGLRIKDLANPEKKMSKSTESDKGVIFMQDSPETAKKKIMSATTDSAHKVRYDPQNQPGVSNLIEIYGLIKGKSAKEAEKDFAGQTQYGQFKQNVAETVAGFLEEFQAKLADVKEQDIQKKLIDCEAKMNKQANDTLYKVQKAVGLR
ncbi:MAG TPA: tryptophan--tRNA ligase [Candidatus Saccharimonadales bacterium]|nr:tryptophan--tRNA ligase [Candidatus Saccharimonadales bacterium]